MGRVEVLVKGISFRFHYPIPGSSFALVPWLRIRAMPKQEIEKLTHLGDSRGAV